MYLGEDSFILSEFLGNYLKNKDREMRILDMGSGSGIQAETCLKLGFRNITAADIREDESILLKNKFTNIKKSLGGLCGTSGCSEKSDICKANVCHIMSEIFYGFLSTLKNLWIFDDVAVYFSDIKVIQSDLFSNISDKFDLIIFNPPYLPENKYDKKPDTTGGKKGDEIILRFLKQAKNHLTDNGEIILLLSSFTPKARIKTLPWKKKKLEEKNLFFEKLEIWLFKL